MDILDNTDVYQNKGRIYFKGGLINQLIQVGFVVKMCYNTDYPDDFITLVGECIDSKWFRVYNITFVAKKQSPSMLISSKITI